MQATTRKRVRSPIGYHTVYGLRLLLPPRTCWIWPSRNHFFEIATIHDDKSPLVELMSCIVCCQPINLEKIDPDGEGNDLIQYRCRLCGRIERLQLFRRSRS